MSSYRKKATIYLCAVVGLTAVVYCCRSSWVNECWAWNQTKTRQRSSFYRQFYSNWRTGGHAKEAQSRLRTLVQKERSELDLTQPHEVIAFLSKTPEISADEVWNASYKEILGRKGYDEVKRYYDQLPRNNKHRSDIEARIDAIVRSEVDPAIKRSSSSELSRLSAKYGKWKDTGSRIDAAIKVAKNNERIEEWERLKSSRSEEALRNFAKRYVGTKEAGLASDRIEELYDDYSFVRSVNTISAYERYLKKNLYGVNADDARKRIIDLEVAIVERGEHGRLSAPRRTSGGYYDRGNAVVNVKNSTSHTIEVMYSGSKRSYKETLAPQASRRMTLVPGMYKVVVKSHDSDVTPFFGQNDMPAGEYSEEFYIQTTRNGIPASLPPSNFTPRPNSYRRSRY